MMPLDLTPHWLHWSDDAARIVAVVALAIACRLLVIVVIRRVVSYTVAHTKKRHEGGGRSSLLEHAGLDSPRQIQRTQTLGSMLASISTFAIATVALLTIMSILGLPMAPLLASAGVGGVALGFGAQSLVKDFLSGLFMIAEDQFGVGDVVELGDVGGTVEEVSLRVTRLRDPSGKVIYVRNGEVLRVANISQGWSNATIDIPVAYTADPNQVIAIMKDVADQMASEDAWKNLLLDPPKVLGVESISGQTMTMRLIAKCAANQQWGVQRELRERIKTALDAAGIEGPGVAWPPKA